MPSVDEFRILLDAVGTHTESECDTGAALKSAEGWVNLNGKDDSADTSGLAILPQAVVPYAGTLYATSTELWTTSPHDDLFRVLELTYDSDCAVLREYSGITQRYAMVRCVAD